MKQGTAVAFVMGMLVAAGCDGGDDKANDGANRTGSTRTDTEGKYRAPGKIGAAISSGSVHGYRSLEECLRDAGLKSVERSGDLVRGLDPSTGGVVRIRLFESASEAQSFQKDHDLGSTARVGRRVVIVSDRNVEGRTAALKCLRDAQ